MSAEIGNKYALGNSGKPKKYDSAEEMQKAINDYFDRCDNRVKQVYDKKREEVVEIKMPIPYTIEGLCSVLGVTRQTLLNYEKQEGYEEFFDTVKEAKQKILQNMVERGLEGDNNPTLSIFLLKNNHEYKDSVEHNNTTTLKASFSINKIPGARDEFASNESEVE